jgi:hypothetical protein
MPLPRERSGEAGAVLRRAGVAAIELVCMASNDGLCAAAEEIANKLHSG